MTSTNKKQWDAKFTTSRQTYTLISIELQRRFEESAQLFACIFLHNQTELSFAMSERAGQLNFRFVRQNGCMNASPKDPLVPEIIFSFKMKWFRLRNRSELDADLLWKFSGFIFLLLFAVAKET